jgi:hypothetical protein
MKAIQPVPSQVFSIRVLLACIGLFSIIFDPGEGSVGDLIGSSAQAAGEWPRDVLAAQIRMQGITCDRPLSAVRDVKHSRPDYAVWVLKCSNAIYRISRAPDMAARVEQLR